MNVSRRSKLKDTPTDELFYIGREYVFKFLGQTSANEAQLHHGVVLLGEAADRGHEEAAWLKGRLQTWFDRPDANAQSVVLPGTSVRELSYLLALQTERLGVGVYVNGVKSKTALISCLAAENALAHYVYAKHLDTIRANTDSSVMYYTAAAKGEIRAIGHLAVRRGWLRPTIGLAQQQTRIENNVTLAKYCLLRGASYCAFNDLVNESDGMKYALGKLLDGCNAIYSQTELDRIDMVCVTLYREQSHACRRSALCTLWCLRDMHIGKQRVGRDVARLIAQWVYATRDDCVAWSR
jgi:hypothetical protein